VLSGSISIGVEVLDGAVEDCGGIFEITDAAIAISAKEATNLVGFVIVVYREDLVFLLWLEADGA
jgi:hypothetical protein